MIKPPPSDAGAPRERARTKKEIARRERLAAALRANLRRRKDQARARSTEAPDPPASGEKR